MAEILPVRLGADPTAGHRAADLPGELASPVQIGLRQDHGDFIAAVARRQIAALDRPGEHLGHQTQDLIAHLMTEGVR